MNASIRVALFVLCYCLVARSEAEDLPDFSSVLKIVILVSAESPGTAWTLDSEKSPTELKEWLQRVKEQFGAEEPVLILSKSDVEVGTLLRWYEVSKQSHASVYPVVLSPRSRVAMSLLGMKLIDSPRQVDHLKSLYTFWEARKAGRVHDGDPMLERVPRMPPGPFHDYKGQGTIVPAPEELLRELEQIKESN